MNSVNSRIANEKLSMSIQSNEKIVLGPKNPLKGKFQASIGADEFFSLEVIIKYKFQPLYIVFSFKESNNKTHV
jgi:hypothetical protein